MKLRVLLKGLRRAAVAMERVAEVGGLPSFVAENTRRSIRRHRIARPEKRRNRKWATK
jgi:hypothetical protein